MTDWPLVTLVWDLEGRGNDLLRWLRLMYGLAGLIKRICPRQRSIQGQ